VLFFAVQASLRLGLPRTVASGIFTGNIAPTGIFTGKIAANSFGSRYPVSAIKPMLFGKLANCPGAGWEVQGCSDGLSA
jgi:hypothetical protein